MYFCRGFKRRGHCPFFYLPVNMIRREQINQLAEDFLKDSKNYLVGVKVSATNKISVLIENDDHVSIKDCIALSRHIEHSLDREQDDFELEVSSPGIDQPFKHPRQYGKYAGKQVEVRMLNGDVKKGVLVSAAENTIELMPAETKNKKKESGNTEKTEVLQLPLAEVKETRLIITF